MERLDDVAALAGLGLWSEAVYRDLLELQAGRLDRAEFDRRYRHRKAILDLDIPDFTTSAIADGEIESFQRILGVQRICVPVLNACGATLVRAFADDLVALFDDPAHAVEAALRIHEQVALRRDELGSRRFPLECCIGVGYGDVYAIGPNRAMGDEMNRAAKLGEDTARGGETLVTESVRRHLGDRVDMEFERRATDSLVFPYYSVTRAPRRVAGSKS